MNRGFIALAHPALRKISTSMYKIALAHPALRKISTSMYKIALAHPALRDISTSMLNKPFLHYKSGAAALSRQHISIVVN